MGAAMSKAGVAEKDQVFKAYDAILSAVKSDAPQGKRERCDVY